jgi:hypothetical protein
MFSRGQEKEWGRKPVQNERKETMTDHTKDPRNPESEASKAVIAFDYELYAHYLADTALSEAEKREFLETMWNLVAQMMMLGFEITPAQQAANPCGKLSSKPGKLPFSLAGGVESKDHASDEKLSEAAGSGQGRAAERIPE